MTLNDILNKIEQEHGEAKRTYVYPDLSKPYNFAVIEASADKTIPLLKALRVAVESLKELEANQESEWCFMVAHSALKQITKELEGV
jgi:hypothetical protein